jgi:hypothetical protein
MGICDLNIQIGFRQLPNLVNQFVTGLAAALLIFLALSLGHDMRHIIDRLGSFHADGYISARFQNSESALQGILKIHHFFAINRAHRKQENKENHQQGDKIIKCYQPAGLIAAFAL